MTQTDTLSMTYKLKGCLHCGGDLAKQPVIRDRFFVVGYEFTCILCGRSSGITLLPRLLNYSKRHSKLT